MLHMLLCSAASQQVMAAYLACQQILLLRQLLLHWLLLCWLLLAAALPTGPSTCTWLLCLLFCCLLYIQSRQTGAVPAKQLTCVAPAEYSMIAAATLAQVHPSHFEHPSSALHNTVSYIFDWIAHQATLLHFANCDNYQESLKTSSTPDPETYLLF